MAFSEKPRINLEEHKLAEVLPPPMLSDLKQFKKKFRIVVVRKEPNELEFDLIGMHPFLVNTFRRLMLSEVPSMAIDKVHVLNNTSIMQDEVLAHRLGLVPLRADPRLFETKTDPTADGTENDTLEFELKIKCTNSKDSNKKHSSRTEDIYRNSVVYSKHIKWVPIGSQKLKFKESDVGPIHPDILLMKLRPGHEIDLKLFATKSNGKDHAKFSPVCTAFYRLLPDIKIVKEVEDEAAYRLQKCFSPGVISIKNEGGKKYAVVHDARNDMSSRNIFRYDDLKDAVVISKIQDHFIFTIESVGAMQPEDIFKESIAIFRNKCSALLEELNSQ